MGLDELIDPTVPPLPTCKVPETTVSPVNVLLPRKTSVAEPDFVRVPEPLIEPVYVVANDCMSNVPDAFGLITRLFVTVPDSPACSVEVPVKVIAPLPSAE